MRYVALIQTSVGNAIRDIVMETFESTDDVRPRADMEAQEYFAKHPKCVTSNFPTHYVIVSRDSIGELAGDLAVFWTGRTTR